MGNEFKTWCKFSFKIFKVALLAWMIFCTLYVSAHIARSAIKKPVEVGKLVDFDPPKKAR